MKTFFLSLMLCSLFAANAYAECDADALYDKGLTAYDGTDYSLAKDYFNDAYKCDPDPIFKVNVSIAYQKLGNVEKALEAAKVAATKKKKLGAEAASRNDANIRSFERILQSRKAAENIFKEENDACDTDNDCDDGQYCNIQQNLCLGIPTKGGDYEESRLGAIGYTGIGLAVVGTGLAVGAVVINAGLSSDLERLDDLREAGEIDAANTLEQDIRDQQSTGQIMLFAGGGVAAVGIGMLIYDLATVERTELTVVPSLSPDYAGATMRLTF